MRFDCLFGGLNGFSQWPWKRSAQGLFNGFSPPDLRKDSRGFSLIELLVVLSIIGILAVAGASYRMDRSGQAVKGSVVAISGALSQAQIMARSVGRTVGVQVEEAGRAAVMRYGAFDSENSDGTFNFIDPQERYTHQSDANIARYCLVEGDAALEPGADALADLKAALRAENATTFPEAIFENNIFAATPISFNSTGVVEVGAGGAEGAFAMIVGTTSNGERLTKGPVGIVLVTAPGNMYRYYRVDPDSKWVRL